jgi:uncharacterized metal-binding protein YceD (DUF177 family)
MAADQSMTAQPWSVPVRTKDVGRGITRRLEADAPVRARIARALDLQALDLLEADVEVTPDSEGFEVRGDLHAKVTQTCGLTLEPLPAEIRIRFSVRCRETDEAQAAEPLHEVEITLEDADPPDSIEGGAIDLGAYVVEYLALELDPFPRKPGAVFEPPPAEAEPSPFAVLAGLKREQGD